MNDSQLANTSRRSEGRTVVLRRKGQPRRFLELEGLTGTVKVKRPIKISKRKAQQQQTGLVGCH